MSKELIRSASANVAARSGMNSSRARVMAKMFSKTASSANALQVCFLCDTTGSMHAVFKAAIKAIKQVSVAINQPQTDISFIGFKNHGDESYFNHEDAFAVAPWTKQPDDIYRLMDRIGNNGGGDGLTCLEDVFHYINQILEWKESAKKIVILIGDMPPHGVVDSIKHCPSGLNYQTEIDKFKTEGIVVYSVYCDTHNGIIDSGRHKKIRGFFQDIAEQTGGRYLTLEEIDVLITILTGICLKETGQIDRLAALIQTQPGLKSLQQKVLKALE